MLFARSIEDNISYGLDRCSTQQVERAAQLANAHRFIDDMKEGYKTEAGEKGVQLSGEWLDEGVQLSGEWLGSTSTLDVSPPQVARLNCCHLHK